MSTVVKDLGAVSAYAYAVEKGYTGTEAEFAELMADYAEVGQRAEDAADSALESKTAAQTAATTATNKASEATTAATTATTKAAEAQADADAAALDASQALSAASTATTKATEATTAAATATSAKTDAVAANTAAQSAKTAAQTAQTGAETAAASVEASAEQIATNAADISQLKSDLSDVQSDLYTDLLINRAITENWFVDVSTGVGRTLAQFYTYENVAIPEGAERLWPMNYINSNARSIRTVCFFDSNGDFISGVSGSEDTVNNGIVVPDGAVTLSATLFYIDATAKSKAEHYLSLIQGNPLSIKIGNVAGLETELTSIEAEQTALEEGLTEVAENVEGILNIEHSDLLYGKEIVFPKYVNPSTGEITNLNFYSIFGISLPDNVTRLYPYNANDATNHALRSVCFYSSTTQDTSTFISGVSGTAYTVASGIPVPNGAVSCAVSIGQRGQGTSGLYYLSTVRGGDTVTKYLNSEITVDSSQIENLDISALQELPPAQLENRKPTFCFIFDDGNASDADLKTLFDSYGFKCGFALIGETTYLQSIKERYLGYQDEGFEILSHSVNGTAFDSVTDLDTAESYLKGSLEVLQANGFDVKGWVTPSTWSLESQMPLICKYYQYGYGHLSGTPEHVNYHPFYGKDIRQLDRWGLEGNTISDTMEQINAAISANAYMIFYGHAYPGTNNFTTENMNTILSFLRDKVDSDDVIVGTPRETINNFYSFRHSDLLTLYNSLS